MMRSGNHDDKRKVIRVSTGYGDVALDLESGMYWRLNGSASLVLDILEGGGTESEAASALVSEYDVDEQKAFEDVKSVSQTLKQGGLL